jgi:hypothetical protein
MNFFEGISIVILCKCLENIFDSDWNCVSLYRKGGSLYEDYSKYRYQHD